MGFLDKLKGKATEVFSEHGESSRDTGAPPQWAPAPEISHRFGLWNEAPEEEFKAGEEFCHNYPPDAPRLLPSRAVEDLTTYGPKVWTIEKPSSPRFVGEITGGGYDTKGNNPITIHTKDKATSVCLLSNLPIMAGLYDIQGKSGVYYEVYIKKMKGVVSIGTACRPYPEWRHPGWNRLSAALHLDDLRKFFEDPEGGRDYHTDGILSAVSPHDTIGCGFEFATSSLFFTYNGTRLPPAFTGIYLPRQQFDVFAAIGIEGHNEIHVNFGTDLFKWKEGNTWEWKSEGHVGRMHGSGGPMDELPPMYGETSGTTRAL
ncbi:endosome protein [Flagelloscypha sp. PMI_526]|nr:endosome protein [Flagelloscypha sp. PMI_526]